MPRDASLSASAANSRTSQQRPRLITPINLAGLVVAVGVVLALLYPQQRLSEQIRMNPKVDEVSLQYMRNLLATDPDNHELRLQLAQAYATIGQYASALKVLQPLYTNEQPQWREAAIQIRLDILGKIAFAAAPGSTDRAQKLARFKQALLASESQTVSPGALRRLAESAEATGELQLAERAMARLMHASNNIADLREAARIALANGHYLASAQYTWRARELDRNPEQKLADLKQALTTLQSGNMGTVGMDWAQQLPASEWQQPDVLYRLTKLALASNRPAQAAGFAARLIGFSNPPATRIRFIPAYFELAYTAFLGNRDLPHALKLAQIAVEQSPNNVTWRERLAQIAEWSNQPQLALVQWRWLATHQGSESAWQAWMRLAGGLFDYAAQVIGLEHDWQHHGNDEKYARKIVQLYEYLGQPEDALAWLDRHGDEVQHPDLLLLSAELLTRMGDDAEAIARYRRYLKHNTASPDIAVTIAGMMQRAGLYQEAFEVLERSRPQAQPDDKLFWLNLGELSWQLKHYDQAIIAYRILGNAPDAQPDQQERLFQALKHENPRLAAQTAEQLWIKTRRIDMFLDAVDTYAELDDWQAVQRLYKITEAPEWRSYDDSLRFVSLRAEMYKRAGNFAAAEHDYRFLISRYPSNNSIKESFLWLLLDLRHFNQLDHFMQQWARLIPSTPNLWDVYAAGYLALGRPDYALALYNRMAKSHRQDELWMLNYAITLESGGQPDLAWQIRRQIWQQRLQQQTSRDWLNTRANARDIEALRLLLLNDPGAGQGVLWKLLRDGSPTLKQNSQFVELATVWLNSREQEDSTRAWLIRQYAHWLNTPLGARISDALTRQDREAAADILDHDGILLYDRMNLASLAGHKDDAADLAFIAMDRSRQDEFLYEQAAPMLLANDRTASVMTTFRRLDGYNETDNQISATGHQIGMLKLDLDLHQINRGNVDTALLTRAPNEINAEIALRQIGDSYINTLKLQISQALNTQLGIVISHQRQIGSRLQLETQLAYNQTATENTAMRLIGRRDQIALESNYQLDRWNQWSVRGELNQYHSIDGQTLGSGNLLTTTLTHELSGIHPALRGRITGTWNQFRPADTILTGKTASLIPAGQPNTASYFMPQDVREIAAYASVGDATDSRLPAHDFEYLGEIGVFYNTTTGTGWRANAGLATRVIGADRLQFFTRYDQSPGGQGKSSLEAGIGYQLHY
ncbi:MAG: tetratricopeptide repeat protein [Sulfuriferula sp.]|nr:tetratricopeptide repeat protein [Sulfuriferula sp.]